MTRFFGEPWLTIDQHAEQVPAPTDCRCDYCKLRVLADEQGIILPRVMPQPDGTAAMGSVVLHRRCAGIQLLSGDDEAAAG